MGKLESITGELSESVGKKNPYRYRGYRYDTENGLYYLNSRYYNPEWGRFINVDGYISTTNTIAKNQKDIIGIPSPVTITVGNKTTQTISKYGNSSKPISVYTISDVQHPIKSSIAGVKINVSKFTLNASLGLDNLGITGSLTNSNTINSISMRVNISEVKLGFECSSTVEWDNFTETTYSNVSINGWGILIGWIYITTGQSLPVPSY